MIDRLHLELWSKPEFALDKAHIQYWLDALHEGDRGWLADGLGVAGKGTVDQWFSTRGFSSTALMGIKNLMTLDLLKSKAIQRPTMLPPGDETALIPLTTGVFEKVELARSLVGNPTRPQFYASAIEEYADRLIAEDPTLATPTTREIKQLAQEWRLNEEAGEG